MNLASFQAGRKTVLDGVFNHGLKQHAGNESLESVLFNFLENLKLVAAEADDFDVEIIVDKFKFFAQRDECFGACAANGAGYWIVFKGLHRVRHVRIEADERRNRVERVEKKMRINLAGERIHARFTAGAADFCSRFIYPMRVLFQILMAMATHITEESTTRSA